MALVRWKDTGHELPAADGPGSCFCCFYSVIVHRFWADWTTGDIFITTPTPTLNPCLVLLFLFVIAESRSTKLELSMWTSVNCPKKRQKHLYSVSAPEEQIEKKVFAFLFLTATCQLQMVLICSFMPANCFNTTVIQESRNKSEISCCSGWNTSYESDGARNILLIQKNNRLLQSEHGKLRNMKKRKSIAKLDC